MVPIIGSKNYWFQNYWFLLWLTCFFSSGPATWLLFCLPEMSFPNWVPFYLHNFCLSFKTWIRELLDAGISSVDHVDYMSYKLSIQAHIISKHVVTIDFSSSQGKAQSFCIESWHNANHFLQYPGCLAVMCIPGTFHGSRCV